MVKGIKANERARTRVRPELRHYLSDPILPSGWYPESDYNVLIELLARSVEPRTVGGDVWAYFGRVAAQRDIAGEQGEVPSHSRVENPGIYRKFRDGHAGDVIGMFRRVERIWTMYHDTGQLTVMRASNCNCAAVMRIANFIFPIRGLLELQTAYLVEFARLLDIPLKGMITRSVTDGDLLCEWLYELEPRAENIAALAALSVAA